MIDHNDPEIFDKYIYRVRQKKTLKFLIDFINVIKNSGKISKQNDKNIIKISGIIEKNLQSRKDHSHTDAKQHQ